MNYKLNVDLSNITNIPKLCLDNLFFKAEDCIAYCVQENLVKQEPLTSIDIGVGILYIKLIDDKISYKFIPSTSLEDKVRGAIIDQENPLLYKLETSLGDRIKSTYKGLY
jgi:hypothetical protein